ncbi:MAG: hypothetical protein JST40_13765 [Armatimonadetes bacterium]|nr:hypothetical protein [Armatimonadota bacterium]
MKLKVWLSLAVAALSFSALAVGQFGGTEASFGAVPPPEGVPGQTGSGGPANPSNIPRARKMAPFWALGPKWQLGLRRDVMEETGIQVEKLKSFIDIMRKYPPLNPSDPNVTEASYKLRIKEQDEAFYELLEKPQRDRLEQLYYQFNGSLVLTVYEINQNLAMTSEQREKVYAIGKDLSKLAKKLSKQMESGELKTGDGGMKEAVEKAKKDIDAILTEEQRAKFKQMQGDKFEFKESGSVMDRPDTRSGGRGGRRSGGGGGDNGSGQTQGDGGY